MSEEDMKVNVEFTYKVNKDDANVRTVKAVLDMSGLTKEDERNYAIQTIIIDLQRRLRSGAVKEEWTEKVKMKNAAGEEVETEIKKSLAVDGYKVPKPGAKGKKPIEDKLAEFCKKNGITREQAEELIKKLAASGIGA